MVEPNLKFSDKKKKLRFKGTICVFPADIWHKVDPVTKGIRYSLVVWLTGDPFK